MEQKVLNAILIVSFVCVKAFAQPSITSFSPQSGPSGTVVTINGRNFSDTPEHDIVYFGSVRAKVVTATDSKLTVRSPAGATYKPISVTTNNLTAYSDGPFITTFTKGGLFKRHIDFEAPVWPYNICPGDLNGDGKTDLIVSNIGTGSISIYKNTTTAEVISFAARVDYAIEDPYGLATGDLDGDGRLDIVVSSFNQDRIAVFKNTSTAEKISLDPALLFETGANPRGISIADIDRDGRPDIIVANQFSYTVSIFRNTSSDGTISFALKKDFSTGPEPLSAALGDVDGDGLPDIVTPNSAEDSISILRNTSAKGDISLASKNSFFSGIYPFDISVADLDGDHKMDVIETNGFGIVSVMRNTSSSGKMSFSEKQDFTGGSQGNVAVADIDGDGKPDLGLANARASAISILKNTSVTGAISFALTVSYPTGSSASFLACGDLNGDGKPEMSVACTYRGVSVFENIKSISAPRISDVTDINSSKAVVHWYPFDNAVSYLVRRFINGSHDYAYYPAATDTLRTVNNMTAGTQYNIQVKAVLSSGDTTDWSVAGTFITADTCINPYYPTVKDVTDTSAKLRWLIPNESSTGSNIRYRKKGDSLWMEERKKYPEEHLVLRGLSPATRYEWKVRSLCGNDKSSWTDGPHFTTQSRSSKQSDLRVGTGTTNVILKMYPNPTKGMMTIVFTGKGTQRYRIEVSDLSGKVLVAKNGISASGLNTQQIDMRSLSKGVYFVSLADAAGKQTFKVAKE